MIERKETRDTIIDVHNRGRSLRIERVQQWRGGFELSYEIFVDGVQTQTGLKSEDVMRYLANALEDNN